MFSTNVPSYVVDLAIPEPLRWTDVIVQEKAVAVRVVEEAAAEFARVPEVLRWVFARLYKILGGMYRGEMQSWADALGVSLGTVTLLNCAYELSHLRPPKLLGCTAGVRWIEGLGLVHVRTLDWPLATLGDATRLFRFQRGDRSFITVGVPGQVGVLSGMLPHAYSITINWAPPASFPSFDFGPTFLVRDTLETCATYEEAVRVLSETRLATSVFFTVCGTEPGQACVIERSRDEAALRPLTGPVLTQANHHVAERFQAQNEHLLEVAEGEEAFSLDGSSDRAAALAKGLAELGDTCSLERAASSLEAPPVRNRDTCQQIVFCPRTGETRVWRKAADAPGSRGLS